MTEPYDFTTAVANSRMASEAQHNAERWKASKVREAAEQERAYRKALAEEIVRQHADGCAWTVAQDLARGDKAVAVLRYHRDIAQGLLEAAGEALWRHQSDRRDMLEFLRWSQRAAFLDLGPLPGDNQSVIGGRRS